MVNELLTAAEEALLDYQIRLQKEETRLSDLLSSADSLEKEYDKIVTWADLYDHASTAGKKMILAQFIKEIRVHRDYELEITLNVSFAELQAMKNLSAAVKVREDDLPKPKEIPRPKVKQSVTSA